MAAKPRAVLDTNVVISGLINPTGPPGEIIRALREGRFVLVTTAEIIEDLPRVCVSRDPDDDKFLAAAHGGRAEYLVTGDFKGLLVLRAYKGVSIISPEEFLRVLRTTGYH